MGVVFIHQSTAAAHETGVLPAMVHSHVVMVNLNRKKTKFCEGLEAFIKTSELSSFTVCFIVQSRACAQEKGSSDDRIVDRASALHEMLGDQNRQRFSGQQEVVALECNSPHRNPLFSKDIMSLCCRGSSNDSMIYDGAVNDWL